MTPFAVIYAVLKAIPPLKDLLDRFLRFYHEQEVQRLRDANVEAIHQARDDQDQRGIERALGNPNAGEPVDLAGSVIVSHVTGVFNKKAD